MEQWDFHAFFVPIKLSLQISTAASILVFILGILAAWLMSVHRFYGKSIADTALMLPLVLPPTVIGFLLLVMLGRRSWIGRFAEWLSGQPLVFTWWAAVIAATVVSFPLVYRTLRTGFESIDRDLLDAGRSIGANEWQALRWITLPLAYRSLLTAFILGFARALGEFGATLMVAGSIPGRTQTVPTAIYIAVDAGHEHWAWGWAGVMIAVSFVMLWLSNCKFFSGGKL